MMNSPIVLVHGAWHDGAGFSLLQEEFSKIGISSQTVELTSVASADQPIGDMYRDAELVRKTVDEIGSDCYVLAHSYGGLPVTEGLVGAMNVTGLIYLTAFVLDKDETLFAACGSVDPIWWRRNQENTRLTADNPVEIFYNTTPQPLAQEAAGRLRTQSLDAFNQPIRNVAWKAIDSTYIICEKDNAIPLFAQEGMSQRCTRAVRIDTDHSPFLSAPEELAALIKRSLPSHD